MKPGLSAFLLLLLVSADIFGALSPLSHGATPHSEEWQSTCNRLVQAAGESTHPINSGSLTVEQIRPSRWKASS